MHEALHIIGICPDSIGHLDLIDLVVITGDLISKDLIWFFKNPILSLYHKKIK